MPKVFNDHLKPTGWSSTWEAIHQLAMVNLSKMNTKSTQPPTAHHSKYYLLKKKLILKN